MDFQWYFPNGAGDAPTVPSDLETETITVTEDQTTVEWKSDRIAPSDLAWQVDAYRIDGDVKEPVEVAASTTSSDNSTAFKVVWNKPFKGVIEISTWTKKLNNKK